MKHVARHLSRLLISSVLAVPLLLACSPQSGHEAAVDGTQSPGMPRVGAPVLDELARLAYSGIYEDSITLTDGRWEGEPYMEGAASRPVVGLVKDFYLHGDLNGDGTNEAVVILWETSGGTGSNSYLAVVDRRDGNPVNIGTALIGDRVQLRAGRLKDGRIELDLVQQGPTDAACCPAETVTRVWEMGPDGLHEGAEQGSGRLSLTDIAGQEWLLEGMSRDEPLPDGLKVTLVFSNGRVAGHGACNRYFGSVTAAGGPADITLSQLGSTRMACPPAAMELEDRYLQALRSVTGFSFLNGKLALTWQQDGDVNRLLFIPKDR